MTLTELRYVVAVARHQHFGHAAEACFVSQPTLSVAIRKLEEELGQRLFERNRSEVIITPFGALLTARAEHILEACDGIIELAAAAADPLGTELRLGVIYTVGPYLVPRLIPALKRLAPKLSLVIEENFTDQLTLKLRRGDIDIAVMSPPVNDPQLVSRKLYDEPFKLALPSNHPLARRKRIKPAALAGETVLMLGARNCFRDQVLELCPACAEPSERASGGLQRTLEGSSLDTITQMVATGAGVTILPATARISSDLAPLMTTRPFTAPVPSRAVAAFYRRGFARPALVNVLVEATLAAALEGVKYSR